MSVVCVRPLGEFGQVWGSTYILHLLLLLYIERPWEFHGVVVYYAWPVAVIAVTWQVTWCCARRVACHVRPAGDVRWCRHVALGGSGWGGVCWMPGSCTLAVLLLYINSHTRWFALIIWFVMIVQNFAFVWRLTLVSLWDVPEMVIIWDLWQTSKARVNF
jgi:hypothetical protein